MTGYDWIVVGGGLAGSALGYELAKVGFSVLLLERDARLQGATRYSYGGIAYWAATTDWMRVLCQESITRYPSLSEELGDDLQFREMDLLLTIDPDQDASAIAATYADCLVPPQLISADTACEMEPLLKREAIAAALHVRHGHVEPERTAKAYRQAMVRWGGTIEQAEVRGFVQQGDRIQGVITATTTYIAAQIVVCAGGLTRSLLSSTGVEVPVYYTHAEVVDLHPETLRLQTLIMPATLKRSGMEADAGQQARHTFWNQPDCELCSAILDVGAIQFVDGRLRLGQLSRVLTNPHAAIDATQSEATIRTGAYRYLPALQDLPGQWGHCLVAFSGDRLPLIGAIPGLQGIHVFSGFSNPFAILPPLAHRFASGQQDEQLESMSPDRFMGKEEGGGMKEEGGIGQAVNRQPPETNNQQPTTNNQQPTTNNTGNY